MGTLKKKTKYEVNLQNLLPHFHTSLGGVWWWALWRPQPSYCWWFSQTECRPAGARSHSSHWCSGSNLKTHNTHVRATHITDSHFEWFEDPAQDGPINTADSRALTLNETYVSAVGANGSKSQQTLITSLSILQREFIAVVLLCNTHRQAEKNQRASRL